MNDTINNYVRLHRNFIDAENFDAILEGRNDAIGYADPKATRIPIPAMGSVVQIIRSDDMGFIVRNEEYPDRPVAVFKRVDFTCETDDEKYPYAARLYKSAYLDAACTQLYQVSPKPSPQGKVKTPEADPPPPPPPPLPTTVISVPEDLYDALDQGHVNLLPYTVAKKPVPGSCVELRRTHSKTHLMVANPDRPLQPTIIYKLIMAVFGSPLGWYVQLSDCNYTDASCMTGVKRGGVRDGVLIPDKTLAEYKEDAALLDEAFGLLGLDPADRRMNTGKFIEYITALMEMTKPVKNDAMLQWKNLHAHLRSIEQHNYWTADYKGGVPNPYSIRLHSGEPPYGSDETYYGTTFPEAVHNAAHDNTQPYSPPEAEYENYIFMWLIDRNFTFEVHGNHTTGADTMSEGVLTLVIRHFKPKDLFKYWRVEFSGRLLQTLLQRVWEDRKNLEQAYKANLEPDMHNLVC